MNDKTPVISGEAHLAIAQKMRAWSGWSDATLVLGSTGVPGTPAKCNHPTHTFTADPEMLLLNPNKVLLTVTPFRLKQEAVLTGALLHEAGHARFSRWQPRTEEEVKALRHGDGTPVQPHVLEFARLLEEPRIEGMVARRVDTIEDVSGLVWTMRASAAHLLPMSKESADPDQALMDMVGSWVLRAGRVRALMASPAGTAVVSDAALRWADRFDVLLHNTIEDHLKNNATDDHPFDPWAADNVMNLLNEAVRCKDNTGPSLLDAAHDILKALFPETLGENVQIVGGCGAGGEGDESEEGSSEGEGQGSESESESGEGQGEGEGDDEEQDPKPGTTAAKLASIEAEADNETEQSAKSESTKPTEIETPDSGAGVGVPKRFDRLTWRAPSKEEREVAAGAERFLRSLISPTETAKVTLSESPAATVDGAALSSWKAGGQVRDPLFFKRTRREVQPTPPVKVAICVDISGSMDVMQKPSALLSWALANAVLDLRNFAGRGQQVASCLIHWGDTAEVIQHNGETLPGIREVRCDHGTTAMDKAHDLIEEEMPGFFDVSPSGKPENRLLVHFTDWELSNRPGSHHVERVSEQMSRALAAGVNVLSVVPPGYGNGWSRSSLDAILATAPVQRGRSLIHRVNSRQPGDVWEQAAKLLG